MCRMLETTECVDVTECSGGDFTEGVGAGMSLNCGSRRSELSPSVTHKCQTLLARFIRSPYCDIQFWTKPKLTRKHNIDKTIYRTLAVDFRFEYFSLGDFSFTTWYTLRFGMY